MTETTLTRIERIRKTRTERLEREKREAQEAMKQAGGRVAALQRRAEQLGKDAKQDMQHAYDDIIGASISIQDIHNLRRRETVWQEKQAEAAAAISKGQEVFREKQQNAEQSETRFRAARKSLEKIKEVAAIEHHIQERRQREEEDRALEDVFFPKPVSPF